MKTIKLNKEHVALVDDEDFEYLNQWNWTILKGKNTFYAHRRTTVKEGRNVVLMHRLITEVKQGMMIDHIDGNGLNNQKHNLRICTNTENLRNQGIGSRNTSGYKGVSYNKQVKKYSAYIKVQNKRIVLGYFSDKIDAAKTYDKAAIEYFGSFAKTNTYKEEQP